MALNVGSLEYDLIIKTESIDSNIKKVENTFEGLSKTIKNSFSESEKTSKNFSDSILKLNENFNTLNKTANFIKNTFASILTIEGVKRFASLGIELEKTEKQFQIFLGSTEKAKSLLQELNTFADFTPFDTSEVIETAKILMNFNFSLEETKNLLNILGDVAAGSGANLKDIATIFGQITLSGTLLQQDLIQLNNRGIPVLQYLSKVLNVSIEDVRKLKDQGKITAEDVRNAFILMGKSGSIYSNAMNQIAQTNFGVLSTIKSQLINIVSNLSKIIIDLLSPILKLIQYFIDFINNLIKSFYDFYQSLSPVTKSFLEVISIFGLAITTLPILINIINFSLIPAFLNFANVLISKVIASITAMNAILGPVGWILIGISAIVVVMIRNFEVWRDVLDPISDIFDKIKKAIEAVKNSFNELLNFLSKKLSFNFIDDIKKTIVEIDVLQITLRSFAFAFGSAISLVAGFLNYAINNIKLLINFFFVLGETTQNIILIFKALYETINQIDFSNFYESIKNLDFAKVSETVNNLKNNFKEFGSVFENFFSSQKENVEITIDKIKEMFKSIFEKKNKIEIDSSELEKINEKLNVIDEAKDEKKEIKVSFAIEGGNFLGNFINWLNKALNNLPNQKVIKIEISNESIDKINKSVSSILTSLDALLNSFNVKFEAITKKMKNQLDWINYAFSKLTESEKQNYDDSINALDESLKAKRDLYEQYMREIELISNENYMREKARLEEEYEHKKQLLREEYEQRKQQLLQNSVDSEQYYINLQILNNDFNENIKLLEQNFQDDLKRLQQKTKEDRVNLEIEKNKELLIQNGLYNEQQWNLLSEEEKRKAFLVALEKQEKEKKQAIQIEHQNKLNEIEKARLLFNYQAQLREFTINKAMQLINLRIGLITSLAQLLAALLQSFAVIPAGLGIPIAIGVFAGLAGLITSQYMSAMTMIASIPPPPPPAGLQKGGVIRSQNPSNFDNVPAILSHGETVIDANRTNRLFENLDNLNNINQQKIININFEPKSIFIEGVIDEKMINFISYEITKRIQTSII